MIAVAMDVVPSFGAVNPYLGLIFCDDAMDVRLVRRRVFWPWVGADIYHMHWPDHLMWLPKVHRSGVAVDMAFRALVAGMDRLRARGGKVVWTAHNLRPHDVEQHKHGAIWARWEAEIFARVDAVVAMSAAVEEAARAAVPLREGVRFEVIGHPHYRPVYEAHQVGQAAARAALRLPDGETVIGLVGMVRGYKDPAGFVRVWTAAGAPGRLLIAGECLDAGLRAEVAAEIGGDGRVLWLDRALGEAEYVQAVEACDLLAYNFTANLNSGSILSALSLGRPVLAPKMGASADLLQELGPEWVRLFEGPLQTGDLAQAVAEMGQAPTEGPDLSARDPGHIARQHVDLYKALLREG